MKINRVAIDFDGVLIDGEGIPRKHEVGLGYPHRDAVEAVRFLQEKGYECYVLTARGKHEWEGIKEWLKKYNFPEMEVTNRKMNAVMYIDDRAVRFTNWRDICKLFG